MMVVITLKSNSTADIRDALKQARRAYERGFISYDEFMETIAYLREVIHARL